MLEVAMEEERKPSFILQFGDDPELFDMINQYRRAMGWTWKRFFLMGTASLVDKQQDNPDLIVRIADHVSGKR